MMTRVLVVDDEPLIACSVRAFLEDEGMEVKSVGSAEEALEQVDEGEEYDVCIMDMRLPGIDGNAAIRALHVRCPRLRFIIQTGSANYIVAEDFKAIGLDEIPLFRKPLADMTPLARKIRRLAGQSP
jgi:CheY-like chemotaxis protein